MRWIASWTAAPMNVWGPDAPLSGFYDQTVREIAREETSLTEAELEELLDPAAMTQPGLSAAPTSG